MEKVTRLASFFFPSDMEVFICICRPNSLFMSFLPHFHPPFACYCIIQKEVVGKR